MKLAILETDRPVEELEHHGTYAAMFERWLRPALPEAEFVAVDACRPGALPDTPQAFDGYLVTGSRAGVYEDHPWIAPLIAFLQEIRRARVPLTGVCFGHQIMAQAFGGTVEKAPDGWILGRLRQALTDEGEALFGPGPLWQISMHQDRVVTLPPDATRLVRDDRSPNGVLAYPDFPGLSMQFHPEFAADFYADLIRLFAPGKFDDATVQQALAGLDQPNDSDRVAQAVARTMRARVPSMT